MFINIDSISEVLTNAVTTGNPGPSIDFTSEMIGLVNTAVEDIKSFSKYVCHVCNELHISSKTSIKTMRTILTVREKHICTRCIDEINKNNNLRVPIPLVFSMNKDNFMDPFYSSNILAMNAYQLLPKLSELESILIAKAQPIMKVSYNIPSKYNI